MRYEMQSHYAVSEHDIKKIGHITREYLKLSRKYDTEMGEDKDLLMEDMQRLYKQRQLIIKKTKNNIC